MSQIKVSIITADGEVLDQFAVVYEDDKTEAETSNDIREMIDRRYEVHETLPF